MIELTVHWLVVVPARPPVMCHGAREGFFAGVRGRWAAGTEGAGISQLQVIEAHR